jgi:hypothetical protein
VNQALRLIADSSRHSEIGMPYRYNGDTGEEIDVATFFGVIEILL